MRRIALFLAALFGVVAPAAVPARALAAPIPIIAPAVPAIGKCTQPMSMDVQGNSLVDNAGGTGRGSTYALAAQVFSNYFGFLRSAVDNKFIIHDGFVHAKGASTSERQAVAQSSPSTLGTGNWAQTETGISGNPDANWDIHSNGLFTQLNSPSCLVYLIASINDNPALSYYNVAPTAIRTIRNLSRIINNDLEHGQTIFLADETPQGVGLWATTSAGTSAEVHTLTCPSPCTTTATEASLGHFKDGADFGIAGVIDITTPASPVVYAKVTSLPALQQYSVDASGNYTFNTLTPNNTKVTLTYSAGVSATTSYQQAMHAYLSCNSAGEFVYNGNHYGVTCPVHDHPDRVIPVPLWDNILDVGSGASLLPLPGLIGDNIVSGPIHPTVAGDQSGAVVAFAPKFNSKFPNAQSLQRLPAAGINNYHMCFSAGLNFTYSDAAAGCSNSGNTGAHLLSVAQCTAMAAGARADFYDGTTLVAYTNGSGGWIDAGSAWPVTAGSTDCWSSGAQARHWSITTSVKLPNATTNFVIIALDRAGASGGIAYGRNILMNGLFDSGFVPAGTVNCGTGTVVKDWAGNCSGTTGADLAPVWSTDTSDEGFPAQKVCLFGTVVTTAGVVTLQNAVNMPGGWIEHTTQQHYRGEAHVEVLPGPDGHLYGISAADIQISINGGTFGRGYVAGSSSVEAATDMGGSSAIVYTDMNLTIGGGSVIQKEMTQQLSSQMTSTGTTAFNVQILSAPLNSPVSACVRTSRATFHQREDGLYLLLLAMPVVGRRRRPANDNEASAALMRAA